MNYDEQTHSVWRIDDNGRQEDYKLLKDKT